MQYLRRETRNTTFIKNAQTGRIVFAWSFRLPTSNRLRITTFNITAKAEFLSIMSLLDPCFCMEGDSIDISVDLNAEQFAHKCDFPSLVLRHDFVVCLLSEVLEASGNLKKVDSHLEQVIGGYEFRSIVAFSRP